MWGADGVHPSTCWAVPHRVADPWCRGGMRAVRVFLPKGWRPRPGGLAEPVSCGAPPQSGVRATIRSGRGTGVSRIGRVKAEAGGQGAPGPRLARRRVAPAGWRFRPGTGTAYHPNPTCADGTGVGSRRSIRRGCAPCARPLSEPPGRWLSPWVASPGPLHAQERPVWLRTALGQGRGTSPGGRAQIHGGCGCWRLDRYPSVSPDWGAADGTSTPRHWNSTKAIVWWPWPIHFPSGRTRHGSVSSATCMMNQEPCWPIRAWSLW